MRAQRGYVNKGPEYLIIGKMGKEFKGADFFACRYATAPRMEGINADSYSCNALGCTQMGMDASRR